MRQFWSVTIATFLLLGFAGVTMGAAISEKQAEAHDGGRDAMIAAEYNLACTLRR
jgi:hypothetical protein